MLRRELPDESLRRDMERLFATMDGNLESGSLLCKLHATDASEYQEMPLAVAFPRHELDVKKLIQLGHVVKMRFC